TGRAIRSTARAASAAAARRSAAHGDAAAVASRAPVKIAVSARAPVTGSGDSICPLQHLDVAALPAVASTSGAEASRAAGTGRHLDASVHVDPHADVS